MTEQYEFEIEHNTTRYPAGVVNWRIIERVSPDGSDLNYLVTFFTYPAMTKDTHWLIMWLCLMSVMLRAEVRAVTVSREILQGWDVVLTPSLASVEMLLTQEIVL
jgi:hypothetical protein